MLGSAQCDPQDKPYTLLPTQNSISEQPMHHSSLCLLTRLKSIFRTRFLLFQIILILCLVLTLLRFYPFSDHLSRHGKAYSLTFSIDSINPTRSAAVSQSVSQPVSHPPSQPASHPPSQPASPAPSPPTPSFPQPQPPLLPPAITKAGSRPAVPRPVVPHPLRPLPPPPPTSAALCARCGCSSDSRIRREFNPPDELVIQRSPNATISIDSDDQSSAVITQIWSSIRDVYCQHPLLASEAALTLLDRSVPDSSVLPATISTRASTLQVGLPTQYIFTKTSALGRTGGLRPDYFRRHVKAIRDHLSTVARRGGKYLEETEKKWGPGRRQLIWIVIEDGESIAADIQQVLSQSGLPFIYFAYGPTRHHGNAQQNSAYALIHRLSRTILGHGPILSIDDDGKVLSEVFDIAWRVHTFGVWPMGNLGPSGWEGPEYDPVTLEFLTWRQAPEDDRPFPLDNGAFVFSSEVFGTNFRLVGPRYWPTDYPGGESEFVSQIISKQELVEPLCYNCRVAWHNQKLPEDCIKHLPSCKEL
ncbi:Beta-1,3-glucuronyltransferase 2 (Glucuronosyltransferase S) [Puccinia graminis f. sp. tritici]|uniref:Beta-1,3-glucuronyltransferase 2 (Glucuronosyltransferase S) n=1 Tax=Puccinia graminis f. sp. tritici TaxID=56615 RepID=A0A5B0PFS9_PUCGR|nr:Beta-1,3-glucuronyltransferase 2 (Glucuronosyltransferase S) [Puccinia graminis f. sp. tritici]